MIEELHVLNFRCIEDQIERKRGMIKRIRLQNFKVFQHTDLSGFSEVTLIGGHNNIGKTSLLEAIFLFYDFADAGMFFRHLNWRGLQLQAADTEVLFAPAFYNLDMKQPIAIEVWDDIYQATLDMAFNPLSTLQSVNVDFTTVGQIFSPAPTVSMSYSFDLHYQLAGGKNEHITLAVKQSLTNVSIQFEPNPTTIIPDPLRRTVICLPLQFKPNSQEDVVRFSKLDVERKNARVIEFLRILEPQLEGISSVVQPATAELYADVTGMTTKIPVPLLGDGMRRLLSIILAIASAPRGIVLIDEIDAGLHYSVLPKVWQSIFQAAREFQCQIIATTHSYECLQAAHEGSQATGAQSIFSYIRLEKPGSDVIGKPYTHEILGAALAQGWEIR